MMRLPIAGFGLRLKRLILLVACIITSFSLMAQAQQRTGKVTDENGKPVAGVSVTVKDAAGGTTTNEAGEFKIAAAAGQVLRFSSASHETKELVLSTESSLNISTP